MPAVTPQKHYPPSPSVSQRSRGGGVVTTTLGFLLAPNPAGRDPQTNYASRLPSAVLTGTPGYDTTSPFLLCAAGGKYFQC